MSNHFLLITSQEAAAVDAWFCNCQTDSTQTNRVVYRHRCDDEVCKVGLAVMWPWTWKQLVARQLHGEGKPNPALKHSKDIRFVRRITFAEKDLKKVSTYARRYSFLRDCLSLNSQEIIHNRKLEDKRTLSRTQNTSQRDKQASFFQICDFIFCGRPTQLPWYFTRHTKYIGIFGN